MNILTKFFSNKYYREQFVNGSLYFSSLTEYTKVISERYLESLAENGCKEAKDELDKLHNSDQRDVFEGTIATIPSNFHATDDILLLPNDFSDYLVCDKRIRAKGYDYCKVQCFCMLDCKYEIGEYGCQRGVDVPNMNAFGQYVVIILNPEKFIKKVIEAANNHGYDVLVGPISYHPLKYVDKTIIEGSFVHMQMENCILLGDVINTLNDDQKYDAFDKWDKYRNQREWRIVINNHIAEDKPIRLEVGDLSDIVIKCSASEFDTRICKLLNKHRFCTELKGFEGTITREKMRDDFYSLGNREGYLIATMGKVKYAN